MRMRRRRPCILAARSTDDGATWEPLGARNLRNPGLLAGLDKSKPLPDTVVTVSAVPTELLSMWIAKVLTTPRSPALRSKSTKQSSSLSSRGS